MSDESGLSPVYAQIAKAEHAALSDLQRSLLSQIHDAWVWDEAAILAGMDAIERHLERNGKHKNDLCTYFPELSENAIHRWFTDCSISLKHFLRLQRIPLIAGVVPNPDDLPLHRNRVAIRWIRRDVLKDEDTPKRQLQWEEYRFLDFVHRNANPEIEAAYAQCPAHWKSSKYTVKWLIALMNDWGRSSRLFRLEINLVR